MAYTLVLLLAFGGYLAWFYWNRAKNIRNAGGAEQFGQQLYRRQFGFAVDENLKHYFNGQMYLGPLRPDVGPSSTEKIVGAAFGTSYRGALVAFALSDQDRCAICIEPGDHTKMKDKLDAMKGEHLGMSPYALFGAPKPSIRRGREVFAQHPDCPRPDQGPKMVGMSGKLETLELIHIEPAGAPPLTLWIEPLGAQALLAWSQLATTEPFGAAYPRTT